jgi:hypothetical protein
METLPSASNVSQKTGRSTPEKVRPDLNLEKWSIWQPAKSTNKKTRVLRREVVSGTGDRITSEVTIGYVDRIGTITTEDQKTCYALIKIWEENGRPPDKTYLSLRRLARVKMKKWGTNVIEAESHSLTRLRAVPLILVNAYFDSTSKETAEVLDTFNILADLKIITHRKDGHITREAAYFKFNDLILKNLLNNYTKPVLLEVVLGFKSEIAQLLYTHLDLVMARRNYYERKSQELFFDDLGLHGEEEYKYPSGRKRKLEKALQELRGVRLSTGVIASATIEKTKDGKDYKVVFQKGSIRARQSRDTDPPVGGGGAMPTVEEGEVSGHEQMATREEEQALTKESPADDQVVTQARELVRYFYKIFHNTEKAYFTSKPLDQAIALIAQHGEELARFIVDFAHKAAPETNFQIQTFGGVLQYTSRAIDAFDAAQAKRKTREAIARCIICDQNGWFSYENERKHTMLAQCPHDREQILRLAHERGWTLPNVPTSSASAAAEHGL